MVNSSFVAVRSYSVKRELFSGFSVILSALRTVEALPLIRRRKIDKKISAKIAMDKLLNESMLPTKYNTIKNENKNLSVLKN